MGTKKQPVKKKKKSAKKIVKKKVSTKNKGLPERKLNCPGVNWHPSSGKWLAMYRHDGRGFFCAYAESEKEAIKKRDQKLLEKIVGPTAKTFYPKKNYDLKKATKLFREHKIQVGITNAKKGALELTTKIGKGKLFRQHTIEEKKIKGKKSHYVYVYINNIKTCIGHAPRKKQCEKLCSKFLTKQAPTYVDDYKDLREETISRFTETPCDATYKLMLFAHGACNWNSVLLCADLPKEKLAEIAKKQENQ